MTTLTYSYVYSLSDAPSAGVADSVAGIDAAQTTLSFSTDTVSVGDPVTFTYGMANSATYTGYTLSDGGPIIEFNGRYFGLTNTNYGTSDSLTPESDSSFSGSPLCYLRGTHILTPTGEKCIEELRIGDDVVTRFNGIQPIKWIGRQSYDFTFVKANREKLPVCVRAGALGDRLPARDLYVSPGHSVLVGDNLVLASLLVNGVTITQDWSSPNIDYFQIELDTHDCVIAEGAWAETYADFEELRNQFHNVAEFHGLYPDYQTPEELSLCAPRPERGAKLGEALRPVVARALAGVKPGTLHGAIDRIAFPWKITGWANDKANPELPVMLEVMLDDAVIGTFLACDYRADLRTAKIGKGRCSFAWRSPVRLPADAADRLTIRRASDHAAIKMTRDCKDRIAADTGAPIEQRGLRLVA